MILREMLKEIYFFKIKKWTTLEYRIYRFKKMGMNIGEDPWIFSDDIDNYMGISEIHKEPSWMTSSEFLSLHRFGYLY